MVSLVYKPTPTPAKWQEIEKTLTGYWERERWDLTEPIFDGLRPQKWNTTNKTINFSRLQSGIREEIKYFLVQRLQEHTLRLQTAAIYGVCFTRLADFLEVNLPR